MQRKRAVAIEQAYQQIVAPHWSVELRLINSTTSNRQVRLLVHRWRRRAVDEKPRVLLFVHGGGMVFPQGEHGDPQITWFNRFGPKLLIVAVEYALAPQHMCPAAALDVIDAFEWLHAHAADLGASSAPMTMVGLSAGGNLVAVAAQHAARHRLPLRSAGVWWPMVRNSVSSNSYRKWGITDSKGRNAALPTTTMSFFWQSYMMTSKHFRPLLSFRMRPDCTELAECSLHIAESHPI